MPMIRLQPFSTTTTAPVAKGSRVLAVAATTGLTRRCFVSVTDGASGWRLEVDRVIDATHILARKAGFTAMSTSQGPENIWDLSDIPVGSVVSLEEQWVQDLYQDDAPANLAIPVK